MQNTEIREKLKKIAMDNYDKGGDSFIECWDSKDWDKFIVENEDPERMLKTLMGIKLDQFNTAQNEIF
jgi:hypothetical protein